MQAKYISYQETNAFSSTVLDYIGKNEKLSSFYKYEPDFTGFTKAIAERNFSADRAILVSTLQKQYSSIHVSSLVKANIELSADKKTFTVTTGHQLNIFTGPLYFIYKIVTAINLASD